MKRNIIKVFYTLLCCLLLCLPLRLPALPQTAEQQNPLQQEHLPADSLPDEREAELRQISSESLQQLHADSDMDYNLASPDDSLWLRFRSWLFVQFLRLFGSPAALGALEIIIYILILITLLYTVLRLLNVDLQGLFLPKNRRTAVLQQEHDTYENIHEIDFNNAIEEALQAKEYNVAVRLLYLSALKELTDREYIHWQAGKTNYQYQQELNNLSLQTPFRELGYFFEWAWYGNFRLDEQQYQEASTIYKSLHQQLQP